MKARKSFIGKDDLNKINIITSNAIVINHFEKMSLS